MSEKKLVIYYLKNVSYSEPLADKHTITEVQREPLLNLKWHFKNKRSLKITCTLPLKGIGVHFLSHFKVNSHFNDVNLFQ